MDTMVKGSWKEDAVEKTFTIYRYGIFTITLRESQAVSVFRVCLSSVLAETVSKGNTLLMDGCCFFSATATLKNLIKL